MSYSHLTTEDRKSIERYLRQGRKAAEIADLIGVNRSTISRELRRNPSRDYGYNAIGAAAKAKKRRQNSVNKPRLLEDETLYNLVAERLALYWSPEQIANSLKGKYNISPVTIYRAIGRKIFPKHLAEKLQFYRKKFKNSKETRKKNRNCDIKNISTRPAIIETRETFGHWEGDTIVLRDECNCHLATFVERQKKATIVRKIPDKKASTMTEIIISIFKPMPLEHRLTLTLDNGMEFSDWQKIEAALPGTKVYYCDPYSPWQRGTNENTNGLIRQFFPRKTLLPPITDDFVAYVQWLLNNRPRKSLNWLDPNSFFCCI